MISTVPCLDQVGLHGNRNRVCGCSKKPLISLIGGDFDGVRNTQTNRSFGIRCYELGVVSIKQCNYTCFVFSFLECVGRGPHEAKIEMKS